MKALIRTDASGQIGGGHMMRCLALANALNHKGHDVAFVMVTSEPDWTAPIKAAGFTVYEIEPQFCPDDPDGPAHKSWLSTPWEVDAAATAKAIADFDPDWLIWDHYGLDDRWVNAVRQESSIRAVLAIDDLDDRALGSDFVLDQTRLVNSPRTFPAFSSLRGPGFATLRPEFAELRKQAIPRELGGLERAHVLVTLGMADSAAIMPDIVGMLSTIPRLSADIVMGAQAQTLQQVAMLCANTPNFVLHIDTPDMAHLMLRADVCIGAGGMTSWERCCLGLGTLLIPIAENQVPIANALQAAGAAQVLPVVLARNPTHFAKALAHAMQSISSMSAAALDICDGMGSERVVDILAGHLRPVTTDDAELLFHWRNTSKIRMASLNTAMIEWESHIAWVNDVTMRRDGVWWIYSEGGRDLGHINARRGEDGLWRWGFYIGAVDAPKGAGQRMLARSLGSLFSRTDCNGIEAEVRADNLQSVALHRTLGFQQIAERSAGAVLVFLLSECEMVKRFAIQFPKEQSL